MVASELRKRSIFFIVSSGIIVLILLIIPHEDSIVSYVRNYFGVIYDNEGKLISNTDAAALQFVETVSSLLLNFLHLIKIILWMAIVIIFVRFVNYLVFNLALRNSSQNEISSLVKTILSVIISIVAFFIIFQSQYPNVQLAPLFTGSTILGIVVGLALQDTLGNLFAGIALQADQPFALGDVVLIQGKGMGVVENISWRGVKIRTFQNKLLVISNSVLGKEAIEVAPKDNLNARIVPFSTLYANSPANTIAVVREAVRQIENVSQKIRPIVRIHHLGDSGIEWEVKYWLDDYTKHNDTDALIRQRIWYALQREHIEFAYPTRTIHIETKPQEEVFIEAKSDIYDRLNNVPIFAPLSDEETRKLARASRVRVFAPDERIVRQGQEGNSMFVIHRGEVRIQFRENGNLNVIRHLREGDFFGEMGLLTGEPRTATVVAEQETEVLEINNLCLKPILEANPELVDTLSDIIEERRAAFEKSEVPDVIKQKNKVSMFNSMRKFFGLGN